MNPHFAAVRHVYLVVAQLCCDTPCQLPAERWEFQSLEKTQRQSSSFQIYLLFSRCYVAWKLCCFGCCMQKLGVIWGRVYL